MSAQVTAMGIRDGDPAVLQALVNRRGGAVLAYCERACAPSMALDAAADAFVRFRAQVLATDRPSDINPEVALLSATRHAAAARAPRPPAKGGSTGLGRLLGSKAPSERLPDVPTLLADRADGLIDPQDEDALEALLDSSPVARAIQERFLAAEDAYRTAPRDALPDPVTDQIVATMGALAAAPVNGGATVAPVEPVTPPDLAEPLPPAPRFFHTEPPAAEEPAFSDPFAAELEDESADPELAEDGAPPTEALAAAEVERTGEEPTPLDDDTTDESDADEPVDVDAAVPDSAEIAAARGDDAEPSGTVEWTVPSDELGEPPEAEREIAAARLHDGDPDEDPAHLQSASGAVADDDVSVPPPPAPAAPAVHPHHGHGLPGRAALAPAAAVVAVAAVGAMAAAGVFGGNEPSPAVDTGIVPERALQAVPEGEAAAVVDDLRSASADARRRRLADLRQQLAAQQVTAEPEETTTTPDEEEPAAPTTTAEPATPDTGDGTAGEDATGGGAESP